MNTLKLKYHEAVPKNYTGIVECNSGIKYWFKNGKKHREDGHAVEWISEAKEWYIEGKRHKIDGPAIEYPDGSKEWWIKGTWCSLIKLSSLIETAVYLGTEKGDYNLYWLRFLTEDEGIQEFPIIPGMNEDEKFKKLLIHPLLLA